jgi:hypothetical protein
VILKRSQRGIPRLITYQGRTQTAAKWAAESPLGLSADTIYQRIARRGWTVEEALKTPALPGGWGEMPKKRSQRTTGSSE